MKSFSLYLYKISSKIRMFRTDNLACNHVYPEEGCHKFLQNTGNHLPCYKASHPQDYGPNIHCCENKSHKCFYQPWRWRQHVLLKYWYQPTRLHCVTENTTVSILAIFTDGSICRCCTVRDSHHLSTEHTSMCALVHNKVINIMSHQRWTDKIKLYLRQKIICIIYYHKNTISWQPHFQMCAATISRHKSGYTDRFNCQDHLLTLLLTADDDPPSFLPNLISSYVCW